MHHRKDLFQFVIKQVRSTAALKGDKMPQAFARWFAQMYFPQISNLVVSDAAGDGKVDLFLTCQSGRQVSYKLLNTKFTEAYDKSSPVTFYDEITRYWQAFENKQNRVQYLKTVRSDLRPQFQQFFKRYDEGSATLYFITNHRINAKQFESVKNYNVEIIHLDEVLQYVVEHMEGAMPETEPLLLSGITNILTPPTRESAVPTSIVFARLVDFLDYMRDDPYDLLFARNVRLWLGNTEANKAIAQTFAVAPTEFAYSNNGITVLCQRHTHDPGKQELTLQNPRVVNGSQTLHSIRFVDDPSALARVMVRIIEVPAAAGANLPRDVERRKEIVHKISIRSNMQNPIKRWNLVANDDFQAEIARFFWDHRRYYERRQNEWKMRRTELKAVGIREGPDLRWLTQLIASYYHATPGLGPAVAQGRLNTLFDEAPYSRIRNTSPELAYQLFLIGELIEDALGQLSESKRYIANVHGYVDLSIATLVTMAFDELDPGFLGSLAATSRLEDQNSTARGLWTKGIKGAADHILAFVKRAQAKEERIGNELTIANFFKSSTWVDTVLKDPIPLDVTRLAEATIG